MVQERLLETQSACAQHCQEKLSDDHLHRRPCDYRYLVVLVVVLSVVVFVAVVVVIGLIDLIVVLLIGRLVVVVLVVVAV